MGFIGVIDSGVGGLTVLQHLIQTRPYNYVYIADHAFCPYGTKSNDTIYSRAGKLIGYLKTQGAQAVVLACNTMSYFASSLNQQCGLPVYDVIAPTCKRLASISAQRVALLATRSTIANGAYQANLSKFGIQTLAFDCSSFVPFVEQRATTSLACQRIVDNALHNLPQMQADAVVLGCTHFPLLKRQIAYYCKNVPIIECCCDLPDDIAAASSDCPNAAFFTTGDVDFANYAASCFKNLNARFTRISI